jgi:hypothetical protein
MKRSTLVTLGSTITLLYLTSSALAAPPYPHTVRQLSAEPNGELGVTLPVQIPNGDDTNTNPPNGIVQVINEWRTHVTAINKFIDDTKALVEAPLANQDYSTILNSVDEIKESARQEPLLLAKLVSLVDVTSLTEEAQNSAKSLKRELEGTGSDGFALSRIFDAIKARAQFTPVAKTEVELNGFDEQTKKLQPSCTIEDQMKELIGSRCCSALPFMNTFWRNVVFNEGLAQQVDPNVPMMNRCSNDKNGDKVQDVCLLNQPRCGPPDFTVGYPFLEVEVSTV